jgi:hypothetical protein
MYWLVSWVIAIFKGVSWLGFYAFFFGQFFNYATSFADWVMETLRESDEEAAARKRGQEGAGVEEQHDTTTMNWPAGDEDEWSDDDGPPPLEPATR